MKKIILKENDLRLHIKKLLTENYNSLTEDEQKYYTYFVNLLVAGMSNEKFLDSINGLYQSMQDENENQNKFDNGRISDFLNSFCGIEKLQESTKQTIVKDANLFPIIQFSEFINTNDNQTITQKNKIYQLKSILQDANFLIGKYENDYVLVVKIPNDTTSDAILKSINARVEESGAFDEYKSMLTGDSDVIDYLEGDEGDWIFGANTTLSAISSGWGLTKILPFFLRSVTKKATELGLADDIIMGGQMLIKFGLSNNTLSNHIKNVIKTAAGSKNSKNLEKLINNSNKSLKPLIKYINNLDTDTQKKIYNSLNNQIINDKSYVNNDLLIQIRKMSDVARNKTPAQTGTNVSNLAKNAKLGLPGNFNSLELLKAALKKTRKNSNARTKLFKDIQNIQDSIIHSNKNILIENFFTNLAKGMLNKMWNFIGLGSIGLTIFQWLVGDGKTRVKGANFIEPGGVYMIKFQWNIFNEIEKPSDFENIIKAYQEYNNK